MFRDNGAIDAPAGNNRIAIYSHTHPSLTSGGAEISAFNLFRGLRAIGWDAILIAACDESLIDKIVVGRNEFALPVRGRVYDDFYHISSIEVRESLVRILREQNVTLFNAHHFLHIGIGAFSDIISAGIDVVFTMHEFLAICHNHGQLVTRPGQVLCHGPSPSACQRCYPEHSRQQFAVRQHQVTAALDRVSAFIAPSQFLAQKMVDQGVPASRVSIIENGVPQPAPPPPPRQSRKCWRFGYFGQINPFKGVGVLLDACAVLAQRPDLAARIRIAIHGNFIGQPTAFIDRFNAAVEDFPFLTYLGPYDNQNVASLMAACDYVVMPSTWWENSPVVIQEAFSARRPVICTGIGGMAEKVIDGQTGLHFARNDPVDLADRMAEAVDETLFARLQSKLPTPSTPIEMAERYAAVFDRVARTAA